MLDGKALLILSGLVSTSLDQPVLTKHLAPGGTSKGCVPGSLTASHEVRPAMGLLPSCVPSLTGPGEEGIEENSSPGAAVNKQDMVEKERELLARKMSQNTDKYDMPARLGDRRRVGQKGRPCPSR